MFNQLKLRSRILLGYSFPILLLLIISGQAFLNSKRLDLAYKEVEEIKEATEYTQDSLLGLSKMERTVRSFIILGEDKNVVVDGRPVGVKEAFESGSSSYKKSLDDADKIVKNPQQKERLKELREIGANLEQFNKEIINLVIGNKKNEAVQKFKTLESRKLFLEFQTLQKEFEGEQDKIIQESIDQIRQAGALVQVVAGLGTLIAIAITIVISYVLSSGINKTIQDASDAVVYSVKEITDTVNEQQRIMLEQSTSVNQTTTKIQELGIAALQSAEQAENSAGGAKQALVLAEEGTKTVGLTIEGISQLKDQVTAIANQIVRLSEQTSQISTVSDFVADLASQTNMLALNAGVEAARAGEHGKGFAVVAGEIRKLADQSRKSADRINLLVNEVQTAINSTIMVTDEGTKKATYGIKLVAETGDVFTNIAGAVNTVFLNNQQIAQSAKQQAVAVQQVVSAMNVINLGAKETSDTIVLVKEVTNDLNEAAQNLQAVV